MQKLPKRIFKTIRRLPIALNLLKMIIKVSSMTKVSLLDFSKGGACLKLIH